MAGPMSTPPFVASEAYSAAASLRIFGMKNPIGTKTTMIAITKVASVASAGKRNTFKSPRYTGLKTIARAPASTSGGEIRTQDKIR